jgi:hypothetical protein
MPEESQSHSPADGRGPGYEVRDTNVTAIITFIVGLFLVLTFAEVGLWGLLKMITGGKPEPATPLSAHEVVIRQRERLGQEEDATLSGYGWADPAKKAGAVRIPIARAIDLLAERGVPPVAGRARTEVEVNSHSGEPAPAIMDKDKGQDKGKGQDEDKAKGQEKGDTKGEPGKGSKQ